MDLLLKNVTVVDGRGGEPLEDAVIAIKGQRIEYVGRAADGPSAASLVLDGQGRTAVPGLINTHAHITLDALNLATPRRYNADGENLGILQAAARAHRALRNGITTIRDCNAPGRTTFALRTAFTQRLMKGPRLYVSGCAICATGGHMNAISFEADGPDEVVKGVRQQVKAGADFIKLVADGTTTSSGGGQPELQMMAEEMRAGVEVAHRLGKRVSAHAVSRGGVRESLSAGVDCIEHGYDLTDDLIATMKAQGTSLVPTLSVHGAILRNGAKAGWPADRLKNSERVLATALSSVGRSFSANVNVACGSDSGSPFNCLWDIVPELQLMREAGLTPGQVLEAATRRAAAVIGVERDLGTLEAGKLADVSLVDGDPLRDVRALERIHTVIKDGAIVAEDR